MRVQVAALSLKFGIHKQELVREAWSEECRRAGPSPHSNDSGLVCCPYHTNTLPLITGILDGSSDPLQYRQSKLCLHPVVTY